MPRQKKFIGCTVKELPAEFRLDAAREAIKVNPANAPPTLPAGVWEPEHLAVLTTKYWGAKGVELTVGFMEQTAQDLRERLLAHMNAWGEFCNAKFVWTQTSPQVRISRGKGGYWSYLGTDVSSIPANQPTMNLESFTMSTPESEYHRVVRHETGHTLGFPHEHMRKELVDLLDPAKTIAYFGRTQGWNARTVQQQVLTPLAESSLIGTDHADAMSIMCYDIPGECTKSGKPIAGGTDIDDMDRTLATRLYPKGDVVIPPPPPPPGNKITMTLSVDPATKIVTVVSVS